MKIIINENNKNEIVTSNKHVNDIGRTFYIMELSDGLYDNSEGTYCLAYITKDSEDNSSEYTDEDIGKDIDKDGFYIIFVNKEREENENSIVITNDINKFLSYFKFNNDAKYYENLYFNKSESKININDYVDKVIENYNKFLL